MSIDYAKGKPVGGNGTPFYDSPPAIKALDQWGSLNANASSVITMSADTTALEIAAQGQAAAMRWVWVTDGTSAATSVIAAGGSTDNYDHIIPSGEVRRFVVPIEVQRSNGAPNASAVGANVSNGLFQRVAFKSVGVGSVFVTEYGSSNTN